MQMAPGNGLGVCRLRGVEDSLNNIELQLMIIELRTIQLVVPIVRVSLVGLSGLCRILDQSTHGTLRTYTADDLTIGSTQVNIVHGGAGNRGIECGCVNLSILVERRLLHDVVERPIEDKAMATLSLRIGRIVIGVCSIGIAVPRVVIVIVYHKGASAAICIVRGRSFCTRNKVFVISVLEEIVYSILPGRKRKFDGHDFPIV